MRPIPALLPVLLVLVVPPAGAVGGADLTVDRWIRELRSADPNAREHAVSELVEIGDRALDELRAVIAGPPSEATRIAARRAFAAIAGVTPERASELDERFEQVRSARHPRIAEAAREVLALGPGAVRYALDRAEGDGAAVPAELARRLEALAVVRDLAEGRNRDDAAARRLAAMGAEVVGELAAVADDPSLDVEWRRVAAERALHLGGEQAVASSRRWLASEVDGLRDLALARLAHDGDPDHFAATVAALGPAVDADPTVRLRVESYADRLPSEVLAGLLEHEDGPWRRLVAARELGRRRAGDAREALLDAADDRDERVAAAAVRALGRVGDPEEDVDDLADQLDRSEPEVRRAAVEALLRLGGERAVAWASTALCDPDPSVRADAARRLGEHGDQRAVAPLVASLADPDAPVLAAVTASLADLTGQTHGTVVAASDEDELDSARGAWRRWWRTSLESDEEEVEEEENDDDPEEEDEVDDPARPLAEEGGRVLSDLAGTLRSEFRPYGSLEEEGRSPEALLAAAREAMEELRTRQEDPDDADWPTLELGEEDRAVLGHLLEHGEFADAQDLARRVGALPIGLGARDYILLVHEAADSMVRSLGDRFTRLTPWQAASGEVDPDVLPALFGKQRTNGVMLEKDDETDVVRVEFVFANTPAHRAGLRRGDQVVSVDGELANRLEKRALERRIDEPCDLAVLRDGWIRPVRLHLEPEVLAPEGLVTSAVLPGGIGYLRLQHFAVGCAQDLEWSLRELEEQGIRALVLDLRNNPGGTVVDAVSIVDKFVGAGETITTMWTNHPDEDTDHEETEYESTDSKNDRDYPLAVLVNECSASASEMTSGSLQDLGRGTIVGRTTWGKGIGQMGTVVQGFTRRSVFGEQAAALPLTVTTVEYFLPSGRSIQGTGVVPDVHVHRQRLLGQRFELAKRAREAPAVAEYVAARIADDPELALELARHDGWDVGRYPGFDELAGELGFELERHLLRGAVRAVLRRELAGEHPDLAVVDWQGDEDVRLAVAALASDAGLELSEHPEYADLSEE